MGYELRRWLADRLPDGLSSGERLVALEIADQAHERTRLAFGRELLDIVVRRCGLSDAKQVGKILAKLGANGLEMRVPIKGKDGQPLTDKLGRVMYACKGHELTLRIPKQNECPALKVPPPGELQSSPVQGPIEHKAPPAGAQRSPAGGTKLPQPGDPTSHHHSDLSSLFSPASAGTQTPPVAPSDEREKILIAYTTALGRPVDGFVRKQILEQAGQLLADQFPLWWLEARAKELPQYGFDLVKHVRLSKAPTQAQRPADALPDWCGQCFHPNNRMIKDPERDNELVECKACNPIAIARQRRAATGDAA